MTYFFLLVEYAYTNLTLRISNNSYATIISHQQASPHRTEGITGKVSNVYFIVLYEQRFLTLKLLHTYLLTCCMMLSPS